MIQEYKGGGEAGSTESLYSCRCVARIQTEQGSSGRRCTETVDRHDGREKIGEVQVVFKEQRKICKKKRKRD